MTMVSVEVKVQFEFDMPDHPGAYAGAATTAARMAQEKAWLEEDGEYLIDAMANFPTTISATVEAKAVSS